MGEHTPGPWKVITSNSYNDQIQGSDGKGIADCFDERDWRAIQRRRVSYDFSPGEAEANARLIAAAPEMLEALEESVKMHLPEGSMCRKRAQAAIAKATGAETK